MEQAIEYFSLYGGVDARLALDLFEDIMLSSEIHFVQQFALTERVLEPSYVSETPYREILTAVARGDGRLSNVYRRAKIGEGAGGEIVDTLVGLGMLSLEHSRQAPLRSHPKHSLKKHLRHYRIEPKVRFSKPFIAFGSALLHPIEKSSKEGVALPL